jgi:ABC-type multidrug transport system fused ATPase/permease subunit
MKIIEIVLKYFKKHPWFILFNLSFCLLIPFQNVYLPSVYGNLINSIKNNDNFVNLFIYIIVILSLLQVGHLLSSSHDVKLYPSFQSFIRKEMIELIFNKFETNYNDLATGELISKFIKIPSHVSKWYDKFKGYMLPYLMVYVVSIILFFKYDKVLGICLFLLLFVFICIIIIVIIHSFKSSIHKDDKHNEIHEEIEDILKNLVSVYSYNEKEKELNKIKDVEKEYKDSYEDMMKYETIIRMYVTPLVIIFLVLFLLRCIKLSNKKHIDFSKFVPLFIILTYILNSMIILTDQSKELLFDIGIIFNFEKLLKIDKNNIINSENKNHNSILFINNVSVKYPKTNSYVLKNLNLHIEKGDKLAITGPVGSGKTTLIKLILKLKIPTEGNLYIDGINYVNLTANDLRKRIAYIQQNSLLFNRTIIENIKYGNDVDDYIILNIFEKYKLNEYFNNLYVKAGKNGSLLSGGQKQIILAIRLILSNSDIIILDEHTSALDNKTKHIVMKMIFDHCKDKTIIIISHDNDIIKYANRIYKLNKIISNSSRYW